MLIHHQQERLTAADHRQQFRQRAGLQHGHRRLEIRLEQRIGLELTPCDRFGHLTQIQHATHVIQRLADHRKAGMTGVMHGLHHFRKTDRGRQSDHPRARHHHLPHLGVPQGEDTFQDVLLIREQPRDPSRFHKGFQLTSGKGWHQHIPLGSQAKQAHQQARQRLKQVEQWSQAAHHHLQQRHQAKRRGFRTVQHPGLGQQTSHQRGQQHDAEEQGCVAPSDTHRPIRPEPPPQTTASPAKGHQSKGCTQLRHQQSAPQASLKTLDGTGPGLLFLNEHFNATGA